MADSSTRIKGDQNLEEALSKVRKLIAVAEDPNTDPAVAQQYRTRADAMMLRYAIQEIGAEADRPAEQRTKPIIIEVEVGTWNSDILGYFGSLCQNVASHCRCRIRLYSNWRDNAWLAKIYGFESDVRYFEFLYTTLRLHMLGVLIPKIDNSVSLEENCYRFHNAGYNWLEIAAIYGWQKQNAGDYPDIKIPFKNRDNGDVQPSTKVGSHFKRAYIRAAKAHGDSGVGIQITAGGTQTYRKSAAQGYVSRIYQRLLETAGNREAGSELVLRSRFEDLDELFREDNPDLFAKAEETEDTTKVRKQRQRKYVAPKVNLDAYRVGVQHANTADLSGGNKVGSDRKAVSS